MQRGWHQPCQRPYTRRIEERFVDRFPSRPYRRSGYDWRLRRPPTRVIHLHGRYVPLSHRLFGLAIFLGCVLYLLHSFGG